MNASSPARPRLIGHWIDGEEVAPAGERSGDVYDPSTGRVTSRVAMATPAEVDTAVASALAAFEDWSATPPHVRARALFRFRDLVEQHGSAGERCMAISVVVPVGAETADRLRERLVTALKDLKVGDGRDAGTEMGPLVTSEHRDKVVSYLDIGVGEGAELVVDGRTEGGRPTGTDGFFLGGSLLDHVTPQMRVYREEIFGPVLSIVRADTFAEALTLVNEHEFGNGTAVFTRDGNTARTFVSKVRSGMVGVNVPIPVPMAFHSFGGWKRSLFGDHHMYGPEGVRYYTRSKAVTTRWPKDAAVTTQFAMPTHA